MNTLLGLGDGGVVRVALQEQIPDRPWYLEVLDECDPERKLRLVAHHSVAVKQRIGPLLRVIRSAAVVDADEDAD